MGFWCCRSCSKKVDAFETIWPAVHKSGGSFKTTFGSCEMSWNTSLARGRWQRFWGTWIFFPSHKLFLLATSSFTLLEFSAIALWGCHAGVDHGKAPSVSWVDDGLWEYRLWMLPPQCIDKYNSYTGPLYLYRLYTWNIQGLLLGGGSIQSRLDLGSREVLKTECEPVSQSISDADL